MAPEPPYKKRRRDDNEDYRRPRMSTHERVLLQLRREIVELGEPSRFTVSQMVNHLGQGLSNVDTDEIRTGVASTMAALIIEQPHKIPYLSAAIQIANLKAPVMGQLAVEMAHTKLQEYADKKDWRSVKNFIRFLATLKPLVEDHGVIRMLTSLMEKAIALQKDSEERHGAAEEMFVAVMLALPFYVKAGQVEADRPEEELVQHAEELLQLSRSFEIREVDVSAYKPFEIAGPASKDSERSLPYEPRVFVQLVRQVLDRVSDEKWILKPLPHVHDLVKLLAGYEKLAENKRVHSLPAINIPSEIEPSSASEYYRSPRLYFQVYLPTLFETVPPPDTFEAVIMRDLSSDIISAMDFNRREVTRQLITLDLFFAAGTFAEPGISFERLETVEEGKSTWKVEDIALEAILEHIFALPHSHHKTVYYHAILIEACVMAPQAIAPVFGRAIRFLYGNLDLLDAELFDRLLNWFSHHLSNFGFTWKWQEWIKDIDLPDFHPRKVFITQLILKEIRLSYAGRVKETLPPEFLKFVPDIPEEPQLKYLEESNPYAEVVNKLLPKLSGDNAEDIDVVLEELKDKATSESVGSSADTIETTMIDVYVSALCHLGNRSISHAEAFFARAKDGLSKLVQDDAQARAAINGVMNYWKDQPYVGLIVAGNLIKTGVVSEQGFVEALLSDDSLLISDHGFGGMERILDSSEEKQELAQYVVGILDKKESEDEWVQWWYNRMSKSLKRRYL
ncbi:nuclear cap-binding protein complex subunit 1 [Trichomonascus vanleenenianus]|uniref:Sto1p n=1 Tax=Trichomonascus vanleenenianus TaxID=2268995 RepID=UPI003ECA4E20